MPRQRITEGGLWEEDVLRLKRNPHIKNLEVGYEIDGYHLLASYELVIYCPRCGGNKIEGKINDHYCTEYECECGTRWVDEMDMKLWMEGGDELMKSLRQPSKDKEAEKEMESNERVK